MNLDDRIEFETEWIRRRTEENVEDAEDSVRQINDWETRTMRSSESLEEFEERVREARENMGQSIRGQEVTEYYEDGEKTKVEKRDVLPVKVQED